MIFALISAMLSKTLYDVKKKNEIERRMQESIEKKNKDK